MKQQLIAATKELKDNMWQRIRFYNGVLKDEDNQWVFWYAKHGVVSSHWELYIEALWQTFVDTANSIEGFVWRNEFIGKDGGSDWFMINLTETTDAAWAQWCDKFERQYLQDSFMEMIADSHVLQELEQERQSEKLDEFWTQWMPDECYFLPEKYYKEQEFSEMHYDDFEWSVMDETKFNARMQKLFLEALNAGTVSIDDAGELSVTQCKLCQKWDFTENLVLDVEDDVHAKCLKKHLKKVYPKKLI